MWAWPVVPLYTCGNHYYTAFCVISFAKSYELSFDENLPTLKFPAMCYYDTCACSAVLVMNDMVWIDVPWDCATSVTNHTHY